MIFNADYTAYVSARVVGDEILGIDTPNVE